MNYERDMLLACPCSYCEHSDVDFISMNVYCVLSCAMFTDNGGCDCFLPKEGSVIDELD